MTLNFYSKPPQEVLSHFHVNEKDGLNADEVIRRQQEYGLNELEAKMKKSFIVMFFSEFKSTMIIILLIAAIISGVTGILSGEGVLEAVVILAIFNR